MNGMGIIKMNTTVKAKSSKKTYTIIRTHHGRKSEHTGTVQELTEYFRYTLECGNGWNQRIPLNPRTAKSLLSALRKCVDELQGGSYNPDYYELVES